MKPALILIRPLDRAAGARVDLRIGDAPLADYYGLTGVPWQPALSRRPTLSQELMSPDMNGKVQVGTARFEIDLRQLTGITLPLNLYWRGAAVTLLTEAAIMDNGATPEFTGIVQTASVDLDSQKVTIEATVSSTLIEKPLLTLEFDGSQGLGGDPDKRGTLRPAGFGAVFNIEPVWFDNVRNIGQIDGYGNTVSIGWCGEGLSSLGPRSANYASYAALAQAIDQGLVPPGRWATAIADGCIGLGAPAVGVITCHAVFGTNRPGAMMKRWLSHAAHAAVPAENIDTASFDALDVAVPRAVHYWTAEQRQVDDLLEAMSASCNATPIVTFQSKVAVTRAIGGVVVGTLDRSGSVDPRVLNWRSADSAAPYYQLKARAARPASVLTYDQVNYGGELIDRGVFRLDTTYREANIVWLKDGSQWLYRNITPSSGHVPPVGQEADEWWQNMQPATKASDILYDDGQTVQYLQPAEPAATNTADPNSAFGGRTVQQMIDDLDLNGLTIDDLAFLQDTRDQLMLARTTLDGQPIATAVVQRINEAKTDSSAAVEAVTFLGARVDDNKAEVQQLLQAKADSDSATALAFQNLNVAQGQNYAQIQSLQEVVVGPAGASARAVFALDVNGKVVGIVATNDGTVGVLDLLFDAYIIRGPDGLPLIQTDGSVVYINNLVANKFEDHSVKTAALDINAATKPLLWQKSYAGVSGQTAFGATSEGTWYEFGEPGDKANTGTIALKTGAGAMISFQINAQRSGGNSDVHQYRIKRTAAGGGVVYLASSPRIRFTTDITMAGWTWMDLGVPADDTYRYTLEFNRIVGNGTYYEASLSTTILKA